MTLVEVLMACGVFAVIGTSLVLGLAALERNFAATTDYANNRADEMRISDYMAMDLRRALTVSIAGSGSGTVVTLAIPNYYDSTNTPRMPTITSSGAINYQDTSATPVSTVSVSYYLSGGTMYRNQAGTLTSLASNVQDFQLTVLDSTVAANASSFSSVVISGKVAQVKTQISFSPIFHANAATASAIQATTFYNTTLLRNSRRDTTSSVY